MQYEHSCLIGCFVAKKAGVFLVERQEVNQCGHSGQRSLPFAIKDPIDLRENRGAVSFSAGFRILPAFLGQKGVVNRGEMR